VGFRVEGLGFRALKVQDCRVKEFAVRGLVKGVWGLGCRDEGVWYGFSFRVEALGWAKGE
jgi:hypothetical protein